MQYRIHELLNISKVQELTDSLFQVSGISTSILDLDGHILTESGWLPVCTVYHRSHPRTAAQCLRSGSFVQLDLPTGFEPFKIIRCDNGLLHAIYPMLLGEEHLANIFTGQFFLQPPDRAAFALRAQECGFDEEAYLRAVDQVPVVSEEKVRESLLFLVRFTQMLVETGLEHLRQAEASRQLKESEERFHLLSDAVFEGVVISQQGKFLDINTRFTEIFGYARDELIGRDLLELVPPDTREKVTRHIRSGSPESFEHLAVKKDGTVFLIEMRTRTMEFQGQEVLVTILRDNSERNKAEAELLTSELMTHSIIDSTPVGMHMYRLEPDGRLIFEGANPAAGRILGVNHDAFIGLPIEQAFPPLAETEIPGQYRRVAEEGASWHTENVEYADNKITGAYAVTAFRTIPGHMVAMFTDILERKKMEQALKDSEEHFRLIYTQAPVAYQSLNADGCLIDINQSWLDMLGYTRDEALGQWFGDFLSPGGPDLFRQRFPRFKQLGAVSGIEFEMRRKDGADLIVSFDGRIGHTLDGQFKQTHCVLRDVTAIRIAQDALRDSEARYRRIVETANEGIWVIDAENNTTYANRRMAEMLGYTVDEMLGKPLFFFMDEEGQEIALQKLAQRRSGIHEQHDFKFLHKSGQAVWVILGTNPIMDEKGVYLGSLAMMTDITERKQAEVVLQQMTMRLENLHEIDRQILDGRVLEEICAEALGRLLRLADCQTVAMALLDETGAQATIFRVDPSKQAALIEANSELAANLMSFSRNLSSRQPELEHDHSLPRLSGLLAGLDFDESLEMVCVPISTGAVPLGLLWVGVDAKADWEATVHPAQVEMAREVADELAVAIEQSRLRKENAAHATELELRVAQRTEQLQAVNKELETFAYSVSHDLKAPLRGIDGYGRLLIEDYSKQLDETGILYLNNMIRATKKMAQLIDDLLAYSRLERRALHVTRINPRWVVDDLLAERSDDLQARGIIMQVNISLDWVMAESEGLGMVLRNLIDNAIKFTLGKPEPRIEIGGELRQTTSWLWVRDNGIGFEMTYHDRVFEIFQRLNRSEDYPGTGIGLAIVRKAMQRMGGRVWAESAPGQGATFYLEFLRPVEEGG